MKYKLFCLIATLLPIGAYAGSYLTNPLLVPNVNASIIAQWGSPTINSGFIQDKNGTEASTFKIKRGWSCCGNRIESGDKRGSANITSEDDEAIIAMLAQKNISEHGAEFCLTQAHVASSTKVFYMYFQQPNWPGLPCAWFCEPGWDGPQCMEQTSTAQACNTTNYVKEIEQVKKAIYTGNDAITLHGWRMGVAENVAILASTHINNFYPHQVVLGAIGFKEHGIVVAPVTLAAVGDHPKMTALTAQKSTSAVTKTLCAQGYTNGEDCKTSSTSCGKDLFCTGYAEKYDSKIHAKKPNGLCSVIVCKDESQGLNSEFKCIDCEPNIQQGRCNIMDNSQLGMCIKCSVGKYFDETDCTCKDARVLTKQQMKYGPFEGDIPAKQCWTMTDLSAIKECMLSVLPTSATGD